MTRILQILVDSQLRLELFAAKRGWPAGPFLFGLFFVLCTPFLALIYWQVSNLPEGETTETFLRVEVLRSNSEAATDMPLRVTFVVKMPNGTIRTTSTTRGAIYGQITETACVRHRQETTSDRSWITLVPLHNCS